jgi:hypothetical protein
LPDELVEVVRVLALPAEPLTGTIARVRSGQRVAMTAALRAPQSKPAMIARSMLMASISATVSAASAAC